MANYPDPRWVIGAYQGPSFDYAVSDDDAANDVKYYGYLSPIGSWIIMQWDQPNGKYRYKTGKNGYATAWTGRAALSYDYYNEVM